MNDDNITISASDLDALIERKLAEREKQAAAAHLPKRGPTPSCNCNAEGYLDRDLHQFGCVYADPKGDRAIRRVQEMFKR